MEDNESDVFLIQQAIEAAKLSLALHVVTDGNQAVRFFERVESDATLPVPALVILDINLPKMQGSDVLRHMRQSRRCGGAQVIVVSTSGSENDRKLMTELGANGYFRKPSEYDEFMKLGDMVKALLAEPLAQ